MPPTDRLLAFAVVALVFVAVPGPSVLFTISRALTLGRRPALLTVVGNAAGVYVHVIAVALGIGAIVERSLAAFTILKLVGAAYLVYLGVQALRHRRAVAVLPDVPVAATRSRRVLADGFVAGAARDWFGRSPRRLAAIGGAGGMVMIGLGVRLAFTGRQD
ncbi:MAG: LysE family translocator [Jiangellaceae bacterium]